MPNTRYLEVPVGEFGTVFVEVSPSEGIHEVSAGELIEKATDAFDKATDTIEVCAKGFISRIHQMEESRPQEVSIEFGIAIDAELGAVVANFSTQANYKVTLTWKEKTKGRMNDT